MMMNKIKETRDLYRRKGIMRREFLRNEVALSWARSQVFNVDEKVLEFDETKKIQSLIIDNNYEQKYPFIESVLILNEDGKILACHNKNDDIAYQMISYDEKNIGTNGIGLCLRTMAPKYISAYEHFHQLFFERITFGIPIKNNDVTYIVGLILSLTTKEFLEIQSDLEKISEEFLANLKTVHEIETTHEFSDLDTYFTGSSDVISTFKSKIVQLNTMDNNIFIHGASGTGKEIIARFIHQNSARKDQQFYSVYCDKLPMTILVNDILEQFTTTLHNNDTTSYGTIYIEAIEALSLKSQKVLTRLLECKPVNTNREKASFCNGFRFIFSSELPLDSMSEKGLISKKLLNRINVFTVEIPRLKDSRADIPVLLEKRIEKYTNQFIIEGLSFSEELAETLEAYEWPGNYRELDKVVERIVHKARHEKVVDTAYLPKGYAGKDKGSDDVKPLEITEKNEILKALHIMDYNIALTARALGIGRSTLYRKLDKYHIEY